MRASLIGGVCAAAMLCLAAPSRAEEITWLAGDMVRVAAHRMGLAGLPSRQPLEGYLARPEAPGRHPAVVVLHGCGGFGATNVAQADVLKSFGYVALALASLGDADACSSRGGGSRAEAFDAYAALDWLAGQSFVDPARVAVMGYSMGGNATLLAVEPGAIEGARPRHFRAAVAYYPRCRGRTGIVTAPTLILVGDRDDWNPASRCRAMLARRDGKGSPVRLVVYPGATHAFDVPGQAQHYLGHRLQYDPPATAQAWREVRSFLGRELAAQP
jgi:dienelactone hydrolase